MSFCPKSSYLLGRSVVFFWVSILNVYFFKIWGLLCIFVLYIDSDESLNFHLVTSKVTFCNQNLKKIDFSARFFQWKLQFDLPFLPQNSLTLRRQNWRAESKCQFSQLVSFSRKMRKTDRNKSSKSPEGRIAIFIEKTWLKSQFS